MFDIGMTELLVIGIVALIVVGPKDLPGMFRTLGRFTGKMRSMAREFQQAMNDAADDAGMNEIGRDLKKMSNPKRYGLDKLNEAADKFEKWEPTKSAKSGRPAAKPVAPPAAAAEPKADAIGPQPAKAAAKTTGTAAETPLSEGSEPRP